MPQISRARLVVMALAAAAAMFAAALPALAQEPGPRQTPPIPIAAARADADGDFVPDRIGDIVTVAGRATVGSHVLGLEQVRAFVQDGTGGVLLFAPSVDVASGRIARFHAGDSLVVTGIVQQHRGQTQLRLLAIRVVPGPQRLPEPVSLPEDARSFERLEGSLVRTSAVVRAVGRNQGGKYLSLASDVAPAGLIAYVSGDHRWPPRLIRFSVGDRIEVTGPLGQFDRRPPYDASYEIYPRSADDLAAVGLPRQLLWRLIWGATAVLALSAFGLFLLRRTVRNRTRELAQSEREAREYRDRLAIALAAAPVGLWALDRDLRFVWAEGRRTLDGMGMSAESLIGRPVTELLGTEDPDLPMVAAYHRALGGESVEIEVEWNARIWEIRLEPLVEQGEITGITGSAVDVSHHRETERRLEEQTAYFKSLFDEAPEAIALIGEDHRVLDVNAEFVRMFGYTVEEAVGRPVVTLVSIPGREQEAAAIADQLARGERVEVEAMRRRMDGSQIHVSILAKPVYVGGRRRVYVIYRDITEQKNLEMQLLHSQRLDAVGQLAGGVAHDFNNILTAILGHTRLLLDDVGPESELRPDLEQIAASGERAADLTRQLLTFSRRQMVARRPVDLNDAIRATEDLLRRLIEERVQVVLELADELPAVHADPGQLQQIVMNLVINARDAMPDGGTVVVSTYRTKSPGCGQAPHPEGDWVVLEVRDEGRGMGEEEKARMFEPFFTTKEAGHGTGLGLSTVYGIVEQSDGRMHVDTTPGAGTTVTICLPSLPGAPEDAPAQPVTAPDRETISAVGGGLILLVDDEMAVRDVTSRILQRAGFRVVAKESGQVALDYCEDNGIEPDLLLSDIVMPGMSGLELARRLRERYPGTQVVLMTGYADSAVGPVDEGEDLIRKPFDAMTLVRRLRERLAAKRGA